MLAVLYLDGVRFNLVKCEVAFLEYSQLIGGGQTIDTLGSHYS